MGKFGISLIHLVTFVNFLKVMAMLALIRLFSSDDSTCYRLSSSLKHITG